MQKMIGNRKVDISIYEHGYAYININTHDFFMITFGFKKMNFVASKNYVLYF